MLASSAAEQSSQTPVESSSARWMQWLAGFLGVAGILIGSVVSLRRKARWAIALILAGFLVSAGSIVSAAGQAGAESEPVSKSATKIEPQVSQVELGRDLFIAKGCMVCHSHRDTNKVREFGVEFGPDLTDFTGNPGYLRLWLADPASVKSTAQMPALGLSGAEIEALIAFLNSK